jgi:hypothetical protein
MTVYVDISACRKVGEFENPDILCEETFANHARET